MNTAEIKSHRENLSKLHTAGEQLHRVRFQRSDERSVADCLADVRKLEQKIASERTQNLRRWTQVRKFDLGSKLTERSGYARQLSRRK